MPPRSPSRPAGRQSSPLPPASHVASTPGPLWPSSPTNRSRPTPTPGSATTEGWTRSVGPAGEVRGMSAGATSPTEASCARSRRCEPRLRPSVRRMRRPAAPCSYVSSTPIGTAGSHPRPEAEQTDRFAPGPGRYRVRSAPRGGVGVNIVVSNVKGGVGKTTTSVYLAAAAASRGRETVVLVDADPQGSSAEWFDTNPVEGVELVEAPSE